MNDEDVIAAIRANHLKANIGWFEQGTECAVIHWERATVDPGGTIFGLGPYLKVPVTWNGETIPRRVYAPARLRRRLAKLWFGVRPDPKEPKEAKRLHVAILNE